MLVQIAIENGSSIEAKWAKYNAGQHKACHLKFIQAKLGWSKNNNRMMTKSTHSYHRVINFKDDSCFLCNNPAASGPEVYIIFQYTSSMLKYVNSYTIALNKTVLLAKL